MTVLAAAFGEVQENLESWTADALDYVFEDLGRTHQDMLQMQVLAHEALRQLDDIGLLTIVQFATPDLPSMPEPTAEEALRAQAEAARRRNAPEVDAQTMAVFRTYSSMQRNPK